MTRFVLKRLGVGLIQIISLMVLVFFLIRLLPADPVARFVGLNASAEAYAQAEIALGLDKPVLEQFKIYLLGDEQTDGLIHGSLGNSWISGSPVLYHIGLTLPATLELILLSFLISVSLAIPIGVAGATSPNGAVNKGTLIYGLFAGSQPEFSWGTIFIFLFFVVLGVAPGPLGRISPLTEPPDPVSGMIVVDSLIAGRADLLLESLWYLSLPVLTLSFVLTGPIIKMVRENVSQSMSLGFIQYGEAVGLSKKMLASDSLLAAVAPTLTLIGILFSFMLGGAVLIESMFSINGLGQFSLQSVLSMDYPAIEGVVIVISSLTLLVYFLLDVAHALLDPRLRA